MSDARTPRDLNPVEALFRELKPETQLHRDELLFRAGQASAHRRSNRLVPVLTAVVGVVLGVVLGRTYLAEPVRVETKIVRVEVPQMKPALEPKRELPEQKPPSEHVPPADKQLVQHRGLPSFSSGYLGLRNQVLHWGPEVLPSVGSNSGSSAAGSAATVLDMQTDWMGEKEPF